MALNFTKMQAYGNDYVYINDQAYISNCLELDASFTYAWNAFKNGIAAGS